MCTINKIACICVCKHIHFTLNGELLYTLLFYVHKINCHFILNCNILGACIVCTIFYCIMYSNVPFSIHFNYFDKKV